MITQMLKLNNSSGVSCDSCNTAASSVYCRADLAYLCTSCDSRIHAAAHRHERVLICASCARAPAVFRCADDTTSLCAACYFDSPLDRRQYRAPFFTLLENTDGEIETFDINDDDDEQEAASWLLLNDGNLNLDEFDSCPSFDQSKDSQSNHHQDYSVPQKHCFNLGLDYEASKTAHAYSPASLYQSSFFTSDVAKVPETSAENSISQTDPFSRPSLACGLDREARVLRYREKKKNRRFEKMIRYASRKAYAETRPRIKGRFVKRTDMDIACS